MPHRFTLDKKSFEEFLAAASFLQQVQRQALRDGAGALHGTQALLVLMETQRAIELGKLDLDSAMERIVALTPRTVGGSGAAVWLFTQNEFVCGASTGISPKDERLRLQVLSRLVREFHVGSLPEVAKLAKIDSGDYPGSVKSVLVTPVYQGSRIAGALAAFSSELDAFTERDAANLRLLASLFARALATATEAGLQKVEALERTAVLQLVEQVSPVLRELAERAEQKPDVPAEPVLEPLAAALDTRYGNPDELIGADETADASLENASQDEEFAGSASQPAYNLPEEPEEEDISIPFVGVRASLGSDFDEPSRYRSWLQKSWQRLTASARHQMASVLQTLGRAGAYVSSYSQGIARKAGRAATYRPTLPAFPAAAVRGGIGRIHTSATRAFQRTAALVRHAVGQLPAPPSLPRRSLHLRRVETQLWLRSARDRAAIKLRSINRRLTHVASRLDLSRIPEPNAQKHLQEVEVALSNAAEKTRLRLAAVSRYKLRLRLALPSFSLNRPAVRKSASAWAVLAVMISFLALELGLLRSWTIAAMRSDSSSSALLPTRVATPSDTNGRSDSSSVRPASSASRPADPGGSHRQVTDRATEAYVSDMTRFEIAGLRRRAEYGDDVAAFQLGMAYEIGHGVPQNCEKATEWVMRSADDGNAAAEFNLGLRYRDGDGVDTDPQEASRWLRRAFAHKYSGAKMALLAMNSH